MVCCDYVDETFDRRIGRQMKLAIIGMGIMGCKYAKMISDGLVKGIEITAVTRITAERKMELQTVFDKGAVVFHTAEELLKSVEEKKVAVDAVLIVTPHLSHAEIAVKAMKLGLHVLCDKPSGAYSRQARQMREEAEKHKNLVFGMMFNQRTNPVYQKIREIVQSGMYGKMKRVSWMITDWYRPDGYYASGAWRGTWTGEGGGILLNQCPHNLDLLQWICGMPIEVQAFCNEGKYHEIAVEDEVTAYFTYENGATGTFYSTTGEASGINRLEISMEDGFLVLENGKLRVRELKVHEADYRKNATDYFAQPEGEWKNISCEGDRPEHIGILQNFADTVDGKTALFVEGAEGSKSLLLANAMYLSSWKRQMVKLPENLEEEIKFEREYEEKLLEKQKYKL